ncbi:MAG: Gar1/Naf1 family protein [Methanomicrobiales archaeon]|nr:Gar1/Naf1 family protein [Methanomicrobiales archaeon]
MRLVGRVIHRTGRRLFVIHCDAAQLPRLYSEVTDRRLSPLGRIVDIFGKVEHPYAAVASYPGRTPETGVKVYARD